MAAEFVKSRLNPLKASVSSVLSLAPTLQVLFFSNHTGSRRAKRLYGKVPTSIGIGSVGGSQSRVVSSDVGVIPYPYDFAIPHPAASSPSLPSQLQDKSMSHTLRVPTACLAEMRADPRVDLQNIEVVIFDTDQLFSSSCMSNGESASNEQQVQTLKIEATAQSVSLVGLEVHPTKSNGVKFILRAKDPFPVGAKDPVLIVGERVFRDYEYGEQGQVLVFNILEKEISQSSEVCFGWASGDEILEKVSTGQGFDRETRSLIGVK